MSSVATFDLDHEMAEAGANDSLVKVLQELSGIIEELKQTVKESKERVKAADPAAKVKTRLSGKAAVSSVCKKYNDTVRRYLEAMKDKAS